MRSPDEFLIAFHRAHPGATALAFARGRTGRGASSYDTLAAEVPPTASVVVDLGCGCGYLLSRLRERGFHPSQLIGVDMSADELALARARAALAGVDLRLERAQWLSLADRSVDAVLSHLAFMLMSDMERVVDEIARVLVPGGLFATVVGGGPRARGGDAFELFLELLSQLHCELPRLGDRRARSEEGLRELFNPRTGFAAEVEVVDIPVAIDGSVDQVWEGLATVYDLFVVGEAERAGLEREFRQRAAGLVGDDGDVPCRFAMRLARCRRL
jgi:SAM-dependent methyltransferase